MLKDSFWDNRIFKRSVNSLGEATPTCYILFQIDVDYMQIMISKMCMGIIFYVRLVTMNMLIIRL